jgi:hypothetical protein
MGWAPTFHRRGAIHPRHPEVALSFGELPDDHPQRDGIGANRDIIVRCFEQVM